jgi:endonuclease-3
MKSADQLRQHARKIVRRLKKEYPDVQTALEHRNPLELLIATILSAQCTDARVNLVTKDLFRKYKKPEDYANSPEGELEKDIQSTGFFRNKARNIRGCCLLLAEEHGGKVPETIEEMVELPGIGRKTANVVLGAAYGKATGVVVDTHVKRLAQRMGLTKHKDPIKIERDLMDLLPRREWIDFSHRMIFHGRRVCTARKPKCDECVVNDVCPKIGVRSAK